MKKGILLIVTDSDVKYVSAVGEEMPLVSLGYSTALHDLYDIIIVRGTEARAEILREPVEEVGKGMLEFKEVESVIGKLMDDYGNKIPSNELLDALTVLLERG